MRYLGVDFGLRRIGLATSDGQLAAPWKVIEGRGFSDLLEKFKKEIPGFDKVVVGMPEGKIGKTVLGFVNALRKVGINVEEADETLSSQKAIQQMIELNAPREKRKVSDATAAAIILQGWLDERIVE